VAAAAAAAAATRLRENFLSSFTLSGEVGRNLAAATFVHHYSILLLKRPPLWPPFVGSVGTFTSFRLTASFRNKVKWKTVPMKAQLQEWWVFFILRIYREFALVENKKSGSLSLLL